MKRNIILSLFVIFISVSSFCQSDTLNQRDSNGKKTGWWIAYLDENLKILKDSIGATHCMYNYYRRDIFLYRYAPYGSKKSPVIFPENNDLKIGNYVLLDGTYLTKYKNGNTRTILAASNGFMTNFKFYYPSGQIKYEITISKKCGAPIQHCYTEYKKDGSLKRESRSYVPKDK